MPAAAAVKGPQATPGERREALWNSCPTCDARPGEACKANSSHSGEEKRLRENHEGVHYGRVIWMREER